MIHPATEVRFIGQEKGCGLFATSFIPRGTITWARDALDREMSMQQLLDFPPPIQEVILLYSYRNNKGNLIFCWDNTRYINHDCHPNSCLTPYHIELAVRDILPGEEITNHYGTLNIIEPFTLPGDTPVTIYPDDLRRKGKEWDLLLGQAFPLLVKVGQPLKHVIPEDRWRILENISTGRCQMQSITDCLLRDQHAAV